MYPISTFAHSGWFTALLGMQSSVPTAVICLATAEEVSARRSGRAGSHTPRQQSRRYARSPQQNYYHRHGSSPHVTPRKGRNSAAHHTPRRTGRQAALQDGERRSGGVHSSGRRTRHATAGQ